MAAFSGRECNGDFSSTMPFPLVLLRRGKREQRPTDSDQLKEALISATKRLDVSLRLYHAAQKLHPPRGDLRSLFQQIASCFRNLEKRGPHTLQNDLKLGVIHDSLQKCTFILPSNGGPHVIGFCSENRTTEPFGRTEGLRPGDPRNPPTKFVSVMAIFHQLPGASAWLSDHRNHIAESSDSKIKQSLVQV